MLTVVRLGDQQVFGVDAEVFRVILIERVFRVDDGADSALFLSLCDGVDGEGRLTRAFRAIDFDHATFWVALNAQRQVQRQRPGWDGFDFFNGLVAELHYGPFAVGLVHAV